MQPSARRWDEFASRAGCQSGKLKPPLLPVSLQQPTLSDMTMYEMNFSLLVEDTLKNIVLPEYRQIIVEASRKRGAAPFSGCPGP